MKIAKIIKHELLFFIFFKYIYIDLYLWHLLQLFAKFLFWQFLCENHTNSLKGLFGSKLEDPPPLFPLFFFLCVFFFFFYFTTFYYSLSDIYDYFFLNFYLSSASASISTSTLTSFFCYSFSSDLTSSSWFPPLIYSSLTYLISLITYFD